MKHWLITVTNSRDYGIKEQIARIKALLTITHGNLKDTARFIQGKAALKMYSTSQASRIIAFCDEQGLSILIRVVTVREITPEEYKRLEEG